MAKQKKKEKYKPDEVKTLMNDLKRTGMWVVISIVVVVGIAFVTENLL